MRQLSYRLFWLGLVILLLIPVSIQAADLTPYYDGQYTISIPSDWHIIDQALYGERIMFATAVPVSASEMLGASGVDVPSMLAVTVSRLPVSMQGQPLERYAAMVLDRYAELVHGAGRKFHVLQQPAPSVLSGSPAVRATFVQDDTMTVTAMVVRGGYMFRVDVSYKTTLAHKYESLVTDVLSSFTVADLPPMPNLITYATNVASVPMPRDWHQLDYARNHQAFVSREEIRSESDLFLVGVTMFAINDFARRYGTPPNDIGRMYQLWLSALIQALETTDPNGQVLDVTLVRVDGIESLLFESTFLAHTGEMIQTFSLTTVKGSTLYNATFEAPVDEFYLYRAAFLAAMSDMRWH